MEEEDVLLTLPEVASQLGVSHVTAWRLVVREKRMPASRLGQTWAVWKSAVDEYQAHPPERRRPGRPSRKQPPA